MGPENVARGRGVAVNVGGAQSTTGKSIPQGELGWPSHMSVRAPGVSRDSCPAPPCLVLRDLTLTQFPSCYVGLWCSLSECHGGVAPAHSKARGPRASSWGSATCHLGHALSS